MELEKKRDKVHTGLEETYAPRLQMGDENSFHDQLSPTRLVKILNEAYVSFHKLMNGEHVILVHRKGKIEV